MTGSMALNKNRLPLPKKSANFNNRASEVRGPVAITEGGAILTVSARMTLIRLWFCTRALIFLQNRFLSITSALLPGCPHSRAILTMKEPFFKSSSLKKASGSESSRVPKLAEHTSSAKFLAVSISYKSTGTPSFANCSAASVPAIPAPMTFTRVIP